MGSYEILYGLGALILAIAIAWGVIQYNRRNKALDRLTEHATREEYDRPNERTGSI